MDKVRVLSQLVVKRELLIKLRKHHCILNVRGLTRAILKLRGTRVGNRLDAIALRNSLVFTVI